MCGHLTQEETRGCRQSPLDPDRSHLARHSKSMPTEFSDAALREADAAIKANQAYQPSKGEKALNKIGKS